MENKKEQRQIIDLLIANENILSELYRVYAKQMTEHADFWNSISEEEKNHAMWIETLHAKMNAGWVDFAEERFPISAIKQNVEYLTNKKEEAKRLEVSFLGALESAVHIEHGMLEGKFFEIFKDDSIELKIILEGLRLSTQQHFGKLRKELEIEKKK